MTALRGALEAITAIEPSNQLLMATDGTVIKSHDQWTLSRTDTQIIFLFNRLLFTRPHESQLLTTFSCDTFQPHEFDPIESDEGDFIFSIHIHSRLPS